MVKMLLDGKGHNVLAQTNGFISPLRKVLASGSGICQKLCIVDTVLFVCLYCLKLSVPCVSVYVSTFRICPGLHLSIPGLP